MPYAITTRDGITIQNIPDDVPADSPVLRERVARVRASLQTDAGKTLQPAEEPGIIDRVANAFTGADRATAETEALPDWATMPELNSLSLASAKTGVGTLLSNPEETAQIIKANFPDAQVRQDAKGNFIIRSAADGQEYAIKPGFRVSDIPRAIGALAAFTPAGRATTLAGAGAAAAGTQAAIEASQAAAGGSFSGRDVVIAGAGGAAVPAVVNAARAAAAPARQLLDRARGVTLQAPAVPQTAPVVAQTAPVVTPPAAPVTPPAALMPADDLASTARNASLGGFGSKRATQTLAEQAAPDAETVAAAERLGVLEHLQPDHYTTNQAYRQLAQLVKSQTGSPAAAAQREGLLKVAEAADEVITKLGGSADASTLSTNLAAKLQASHAKMAGQAEDLYGQVAKRIPKSLAVDAPDTLGFLRSQIDEMGGSIERLPPVERKLFQALSAAEGESPITYAFLDRTRKEIGQAMRRATGPFKDSESGLLKKLYSTLSSDQERIAAQQGARYTYEAAKYATRLTKGIEDDLAALYGKNLDKSMTPLLTGATKKLAAGDTADFIRLIKATPKDMRQEVTASGLASFFQKTARGGEMDFAGYARWFDGLQRNQQAYTALMSNLPKDARQQLVDLARVARGVAMSKGEFIATGKALNTKALETASTFMGKVFEEVRRTGPMGLAAEVAGSAAGAPGLATALKSAMASSKPTVMQAADKLITSPEFVAAVKASGTKSAPAAARNLARSRVFSKFVRELGNPRELSDPERWVLQALQAANQPQQE